MIRYLRLIKNLSNWWLYLALKAGAAKCDPAIFRARGGVNIEVPRRLLHEFKEIFMEAAYTRHLISKIPKSPTIIDIGANAGFFSLYAASRFPGAKIIAYEPVPTNFRQLCKNRDLTSWLEMKCVNEAVYGSEGEVNIILDEKEALTTSARVGENPGKGQDVLRIKATTLQQIFEQNSINRCHLLKMDCEGSEYSILYNCSGDLLRRTDQLAIEVHDGKENGHNMAELIGFFEQNGFRTRKRQHILWASGFYSE
ncbi:MAG: FkbM family methyltransferase [Desulfobacteraceae bacterium]|nr:MAG: FkbM family methyltransferase [Desulfobacteraceae bacterium]